jgi:hypothetical protein
MKTQFARRSEDTSSLKAKTAHYCGLPVEVLCRMDHCSLVRYRDREFIVNTEDLCLTQSMKCAA